MHYLYSPIHLPSQVFYNMVNILSVFIMNYVLCYFFSFVLKHFCSGALTFLLPRYYKPTLSPHSLTNKPTRFVDIGS